MKFSLSYVFFFVALFLTLQLNAQWAMPGNDSVRTTKDPIIENSAPLLTLLSSNPPILPGLQFGLSGSFTAGKLGFDHTLDRFVMSDFSDDPSIQISTKADDVTSANSGTLILGRPNNFQLTLDNDEIQSWVFSSPSTLFVNTKGGAVQIGPSNSGMFYVDGNAGRIGIGTASPQSIFHLTGDGRIDGDLLMTGQIEGISDRRLKKDIQKIEGASKLLAQLKPVLFHYRSHRDTGLKLDSNRHYGLIAQEVEAILPSLVEETVFDEDQGRAYKTIRYLELIGLLVRAHQEQQAQLEELAQKIDQISSRSTIPDLQRSR